MTNRGSILLTAGVGLIFGIAGSAVGGVLFKQSAPATAQQLATALPEENQRDWLREQHAARLARLEHKVAAQKAQKQAGETGEELDESVADAPVHQPRPNIEESRQARIASWEDRLEKHAQEPVDAAWARDTQTELQQEVSSLASKANFKFVRAHCGTTTCSATVEWKDYGAAVRNYSSLLHYRYKNGCLREVLLPEPDDKSRTYQATVLYDCEQGS
jgi:hypothetical protein